MGVTIIGLGPGPEGYISEGALNRLKNADKLFVQTDRHPVCARLAKEGVKFETMDDLYEAAGDFDELEENVAKRLFDAAEGGADVAYGVLGDGICPAMGFFTKCEVMAGVGYAEAAARLGVAGVCVVPASAISGFTPRRDCAAVICETDSKLKAGEVKLRLLEFYAPETEVVIARFTASGVEKARVPLFELDYGDDFNAFVSVAIPPLTFDNIRRYGFDELVEIMNRLRSPGGCPWDREQTHVSLKQCLIEEAYEVLDAIDSGDDAALCEELGDVLLQVVFHARMAAEQGRFDIRDVTSDICAKLISRHTHIFGKDKLNTAGEVVASWDRIKMHEKGFSHYYDALESVPRNFPALIRAEKLQKKASRAGFDWNEPAEAIKKVYEELREFEAVVGADPAAAAEELGDLLFAVVNAARLAGIEPEMALNSASDKFLSRFRRMEELAETRHGGLSGLSLNEMDKIWEEIKHNT